MNTIEIILSIFTGLGITGGTLVSILFYRSANRRIKDAEADKAVAEANQEEWELERKRLDETHQTIMTLNNIIKTQGETISKNNKALDDKTARLREAQDREFKANEEKACLSQENATLIRENGELKLRLQKHECVTLTCPHRDPPNEYTFAAIAAKNKPKQICQ